MCITRNPRTLIGIFAGRSGGQLWLLSACENSLAHQSLLGLHFIRYIFSLFAYIFCKVHGRYRKSVNSGDPVRTTVDSRYLEFQGTLWNASRYLYFDISIYGNEKNNKSNSTFNKWICNLTPEIRDILKILWKRGEIAPKGLFILFFTIFCYLLLYVPVKTGTRFSLRDMRLFEMSEVEITRVDCLLVLRLRLQHKRSCNFCLSWASIFYCSELKTV